MPNSLCNTTLEVAQLVIPVAVCAAAETQDVELTRALPIKDAKGRTKGYKRVRRIDVPDPGDADQIVVEPVQRTKKGTPAQAQYEGEVVYGVWLDDETFQEIAAEDLEAIKEETSTTALKVDEFIPLREVPWQRTTGAYFLLPQRGVSGKSLVLLRNALKRRKVAAVTKLMLREGGRQRLAVIHPVNGGLMINTLRYASEMQKAEREMALDEFKLPPVMLAHADQMIEQRLAEAIVLDSYDDETIPRRQKLVAAALAGKGVKRSKKVEAPTPTGDETLMERLEASIAVAAAKPRNAALLRG